MREYENISILRSIACLGVFASHIFGQYKIFNFGKYGVLLFFIITGFLAFSSKDIRQNIWIYWRKRIIRILPMYIIILGIHLLLFSIEENSILKGWSLLTADFVGGTWTVWVTLVFYVLAPFLVKIVDSYFKAWIAFLIMYIPRYFFIMYRYDFLDRTLQYLCFCMGGCLIYYVFKERKENVSYFILAVIIILMEVSSSTDDYFFFLIIFMILFISSRYMHINWKIGKFVINKIDKYSYHIFLIHPIVLKIVPKYSISIYLVLVVIGTMVFSGVSYYCIDKQINKLLGSS